MKKPKVPQQIENILTEDEVVEKPFDLQGQQVFATNKRLLVMEGRTIRDFDYAHISSVTYSSKRYRWLIALGIVLVIIGFFIGGSWAIPFVLIGLILIIIGIVRKSEWVEVNVVGVSDPQKFLGEKKDLDSLLQIIRQKQVAKPTAGKTETKDIDFVETIRKLAELRDQGIITQEEFEEKKRKLLFRD